MHKVLSPEEQMKRNSEDVKASIDHMKTMWLKHHPPGTFMMRCASNWNAKDGGLVMIVGYGPGGPNAKRDTCTDDIYDMVITVIACSSSVNKRIETLSVGEAKRFFLLELDRVMETKARIKAAI